MELTAKPTNTLKKTVIKFKTPIVAAVAVVGTFVATTTLMRSGLNQHDAFLREHGLYDAYYTPEENA